MFTNSWRVMNERLTIEDDNSYSSVDAKTQLLKMLIKHNCTSLSIDTSCIRIFDYTLRSPAQACHLLVE